MITVSNLAKAHGGRTLFRDVTFRLLPGRRIALVGGNGVGKTTLLEIVMGAQQPDEGEVHTTKGTRIGYLPQELLEEQHGRVLDVVLEGAAHITELEGEMRRLEAEIAATTGAEHDRALARYGELQHTFETHGGYRLESEARSLLSGLGFRDDDVEKLVEELSGGWRMRVALARLMLSQPEVLVLDEPTNHLDVESVAWLEGHLAEWPGAILFVSHDRDFIDAVAERVVEVAGGTATEYVGGFAEFVVQREERIMAIEAAAARQAKELAKVEQFIERFRYKATKAKQVQSRVKTLEKLDRIEAPTREQLKARFGFPEPPRSSRVIAELEGVSVGYDGGPPVLTGVNLVVERGQKVAFIGPNGAGKSTLLKLVLGDLTASAGRVALGNNVKVSYFAQHQVDALRLDRTVLQEFQAAVGEYPGRNVRTLLGSFGFSGDAVDRKVGDLSGGERTRLALGRMMVHPVNVLVLDEPTNHLDLPSCDILEDALAAYPGTVLLVTHDRHLIRNVADALVDVRDGGVRYHPGMDEELLSPTSASLAAVHETATPRAAREDRGARRPNKAEQRKVDAAERQKRHQSTKEARKRVQAAEKEIARLDARIGELNAQLGDPVIYEDHQRVRALADELDTVRARQAEVMVAWERALGDLEVAERAE